MAFIIAYFQKKKKSLFRINTSRLLSGEENGSAGNGLSLREKHSII